MSGLSEKSTYCITASNLAGQYILDNYQIYSSKPSLSFDFVESVGRINKRGHGSIMPIMGRRYLYISESGWHNVSTNDDGMPIFYVLDFCRILIWESSLDNTRAFDITEYQNENLLILSSTDRSPNISFLWNIDDGGKVIWKTTLGRTSVPPIIDEDNNIYIKHGSKISKICPDGSVLWEIELEAVGGLQWDTIIRKDSSMYYGYQQLTEGNIIEFDNDGNTNYCNKLPYATSYPTINSQTNTLYFVMKGTVLVAFDLNDRKIKAQANLKNYTCAVPIIFGEYIVICYEKRVEIFTENLSFISSHKLKGVVKGTNLLKPGILQILVSDYLAWDKGKCNVCYCRLYEIQT